MTRIQAIQRAALVLAVGLGAVAEADTNKWTQTGTGLTAEVNVFARPVGQAKTLYAGAQNGFYRSINGGTTWMLAGATLVDRNVLSLAVDPEDENRLYAGLNTGLYASADGGVSWTQDAAIGAGVLALSTGAEGRVYAATFGRGIYSSDDRGANWEVAGSGLDNEIIYTLALHPLEARTIYAGTARGLFVSRDGGAGWASAGVDLDGKSVRSVSLSAAVQDAGLIIVGTYGAGVWRSDDDGKNWRDINSGLTDLKVRGIEVDPDLDQLLYAATSTEGFFRSKDGGSSWFAINQGLSELTTRWIAVVGDGRVMGGGIGTGIQDIRFESEPQIGLDAARLDFGMVSVGVPSVQTLLITNHGKAELVVSNLSIERGSGFTVTPATITLAPGASGPVEVRFQPSDRGATATTLIARSNDPDEDAVEIALSGTGVQAELSVLPKTIAFGEVRVGSLATTTVILTNTGNTALDLRNAFIDTNAFRLLNFQPQTLAPNQSMGLRVAFEPLVARGISSELVLVDAVGRRSVAVDGIGIAPYISLSATDLDFGTVDLQAFHTLTLAISNSGNTQLEISELAMAGTAFRIDAKAPFAIAPGDSHAVEVTFLPLVAGDHSGSLRIESDALGDLGTTMVDFKGSGGALAIRSLEPLAAGNGPADMLIVDLDGDGALDLALADSAGGQLRVLFNDGTGQFVTQVIYPSQVSAFGDWDQPVALAAASIFGNGPDLVVGDPVARSISILQNDGSGYFDFNREEIFIGHQVADVLTADLDADGDIDIAAANRDDASVTMLFNNGVGSFNARTTAQVEDGPVALLAAHLDQDDHADLVVANSTSGTVSVLLGDRSGGFQTRRDFVVGSEPAALASVDYDADGDNDLLVGNRGSSDVVILVNDGSGALELGERISTDLPVEDLALSDLTADIFSDLVVGSVAGPHLGFFENAPGVGFVSSASLSDSLYSPSPVRRVGIADFNADGANDIAALLSTEGLVQIFINEDARRLDPPRAPTDVAADDVGRDLGRSIEVLWEAPELDEQIGRTTEYVIFRSTLSDSLFAPVDTLAAGQRRYVDLSATLADTFYYYVTAGNARIVSEPSDTVSAASRPAPFFELQNLDESRFSVGDTLRLRAYITPAGHDIYGVSLFMTYEDSALTLLDADSVKSGVQPFRIETGLSNAEVFENRLQPLMSNKLNLSLAELSIKAGVEPVALGEIWFRTSIDTTTLITIDDEPANNRRSSVVEAQTGAWILPFIPERPTQVSIRDFQVRGQLELDSRDSLNQAVQVSLFMVGTSGDTLESPLNDEDRLRPGIQHTLAGDGSFSLVQIPRDTYRILAKAPTHLQGLTDTISVGSSLRASAAFTWVSVDSIPQTMLPAGDANDDDSINLADYGVFVQHFGITSAEQPAWQSAVAADFNGDEEVSFDDFWPLVENFGKVGMKLLVPPVVADGAAARPAAGRIEVSGGEVRLREQGEIVGFSLLTAPEASFTAEGAMWAGRRTKIMQWREGNGTRIVGALVDPARPLPAAGVLAALEGDVLEAELLRPDGRVERLLVTRARPSHSALLQNYPNPFNPNTIIPFAVGSSDRVAKVTVEIYNALGQQIRTLVNGALAPGMHQVEWDGLDRGGRTVASGTYLCRLQIGDWVQSRQLLLLR